MFRKRKLVLLKPALGKAMVALDGVDFRNLLVHPLFRAQAPRLVQGDGGEFEFLKERVDIMSPRGGGEEKVVEFYGSCLGERWRCELRRQSGGGDESESSNRVVVDVTHVPTASSSLSGVRHPEQIAGELSVLLSDFFNALVFELDGTYLSFKDMVVHTSPTRKDKSHVLIAFDIKVRKFPSAGTF